MADCCYLLAQSCSYCLTVLTVKESFRNTATGDEDCHVTKKLAGDEPILRSFLKAIEKVKDSLLPPVGLPTSPANPALPKNLDSF
ncbi:unnamed protein product [Leptidea sinapis]|uniref:Uncharacterized protein n=1 Tax=Leptidea sinapis TaxID=189913 RepID=A0A5E4R6F8_9NEOP|nr:unnamed protein product [Leptidea sinapis]